jgi:hypothetical protein
VLLCPTHASLRDAMWAEVTEWVGEAPTSAAQSSKPQRSAWPKPCMLGSVDWNGHHLVVMNIVGRYLADVLAARSGMLNVSRATPTCHVASRPPPPKCYQQQVSKQLQAT